MRNTLISVFIAMAGLTVAQEKTPGQQSAVEPKPDANGVYRYVELMPRYPEGPSAMRRYLKEHAAYPESAKSANIKGRTSIQMVVEPNGKLSRFTILKGVPNCAECDSEALRVVRAMPDFTPGKHSDKTVPVYYQLSVLFGSPELEVVQRNEPVDLSKDGDSRDVALAEPAPQQAGESVQQDGPYNVVDVPPSFPGGMSAMRAYIEKNLRYPSTAAQQQIQGKCYVKFVVTASGDINNIIIARGVPDCPDCDKEAIRLMKGMPKWIAGEVKGKKVDSYYYLPVTFKPKDK